MHNHRQYKKRKSLVKIVLGIKKTVRIQNIEGYTLFVLLFRFVSSE